MKRETSKTRDMKDTTSKSKPVAPHDEKMDPRHEAHEHDKQCQGKDCVEEASEESFPASDPPSFTPTKP